MYIYFTYTVQSKETKSMSASICSNYPQYQWHQAFSPVKLEWILGLILVDT